MGLTVKNRQHRSESYARSRPAGLLLALKKFYVLHKVSTETKLLLTTDATGAGAILIAW
jgi:hypothetical protein